MLFDTENTNKNCRVKIVQTPHVEHDWRAWLTDGFNLRLRSRDWQWKLKLTIGHELQNVPEKEKNIKLVLFWFPKIN